MWIEVKDPHNETVEFESEPVNGSNNAFSHSFVAGGQDDNKRFWKPMNESGNNYTMIVGYANRQSGFATSDANVTAADDDDNVNNFRSEVQFVSAYEHVPDEGEEEDDGNADDDDDKSDDDEHEDE